MTAGILEYKMKLSLPGSYKSVFLSFKVGKSVRTGVDKLQMIY